VSGTLIVRGVTVTFGATVVLSDVSFSLTPGQRLGVVGQNGVGKSTLMRVVAGELTPDRGSVQVSERGTTVAYVPQSRGDDPDEKAIDALARRSGISSATIEMEQAAADMADGTMASAERYSDALERWLSLGGDDFQGRSVAVLVALGLGQEMLQRRLGDLSGGESARIALAAILLTKADVVLLDEPTNDLDFEGLAQLETFVTTTTSALIIVSHDRAFLEATVTSVAEIDEHSRGLRVFDGGWSAFLEERKIAREHAEEDYEEYRRRHDELESRGRRQRQWAETGVRRAAKRPSDHDTAQQGFRANRTEKLASKVRISERALDRLDIVEKPFESWRLEFNIASGPRSGDLVFSLENAVAEKGSFRLGPLTLSVREAERIAIVGPNGSGKTTLVEMLLGKIDLASGTRTIGPSVVVGELDQTRADLDPTLTLEQSFGRELESTGHSRSEVRSLLAKFGLGADHVSRPVDTLSLGERTRVSLARFMAEGVNTLVLDEPTNHLDLPAIEQLESALSSWQGTLVIVTHDRRLLENVTLDYSMTSNGRPSSAPASA
jgi:ATPase subunit of ABC transporter with duplicated ATPase domains